MSSTKTNSTKVTILRAAAVGAVALVLFMWLGGFGFWGALFLALLLWIPVFVILMLLRSTFSGATVASEIAAEPAETSAPEPVEEKPDKRFHVIYEITDPKSGDKTRVNSFAALRELAENVLNAPLR